jgi:hypothetical protein
VSPGWRRRADLLRTVEELTGRRRCAPLPVLLWNWRKELALLSVAAVVAFMVAGTLGLPWVVAGMSAMIGLFAPPWPESFRGFVWQLVTPHLLRSGLYHAGVESRTGRRPFIVRVTRKPFGERVQLRCPPGTCAEDIYFATDILRAACRAAEVRVMRDEYRAHMVTVDIIRNPVRSGPSGPPGLAVVAQHGLGQGAGVVLEQAPFLAAPLHQRPVTVGQPAKHVEQLFGQAEQQG